MLPDSETIAVYSVNNDSTNTSLLSRLDKDYNEFSFIYGEYRYKFKFSGWPTCPVCRGDARLETMMGHIAADYYYEECQCCYFGWSGRSPGDIRCMEIMWLAAGTLPYLLACKNVTRVD